jgi:hypothetical protein
VSSGVCDVIVLQNGDFGDVNDAIQFWLPLLVRLRLAATL